MIIANYDEFIQVINSLFNSGEVNDFTSFSAELAKSKKTRNIKRNRYATEIKALKAQINEYKQKLRQSERIENKRKYSAELKKLNNAKQEFVLKNREYLQLNLFNEMSENAKIYACCRHILSKYLPQALSEDLTSAAKQNNDGSLTVNPQAFKDSRLYQDAAHIKDYVSSYFENYPERIKGTRYFIGLHRKAPALSDLLTEIDAYFEKLNSPDEKESNRIKKSHIGIEVIKTYPEQHLQILKVMTKAGLNYEGSAMHHCVGSYASKVEKGETQIYSLRDMGEATQELIPHATVEIKNGKICQIKGPHDSVIAFQYTDTVRDMLLTLTQRKDFQEIVNDDNIPTADKNNIGIFKDINDKTHDLFNFDEHNVVFDRITITREALTALPMHKMKIKNLLYRGILDDTDLQKLFALKNVERLEFSKLEYEGEIFDYSNSSQSEIYLNIMAPNLKHIILPKCTVYFSLNGNFDNLESIVGSDNLKSLSLEGNYANLKCLPNTADKLSLKGSFPLLEAVPDKVTSLGLSGNFTNLKRLNADILTNLSIESRNIFADFKLPQFPKLRDLSLYGECTTQIKALPVAPLLENLHIGSGNYELGKQYSDIGDNFIAGYPHLKSVSLNGTFPQINKLDLSLNPELSELEALGAKFENLQAIKFPQSLTTCIFDFASFPKLKELDFSQINNKNFGKIESFNMGKLRFGHDETPQHSACSVKGVSLSFANFGNLETVKFPVMTENLNLQNFSGVSHAKNFNFDELKNLKELNLSLAPFNEVPQLDLSACTELTKLCLDGNILNNTVLPPNLEDLKIIAVGMEKEMPDFALYGTIGKNLKTLDCTGFLPDEHLLKSGTENLTIHANNKDLSHLTQIDMGKYKYVDLQLFGSSLSKLKKVIFPQTFKKMNLNNTSEKFQELDFENTEGKINICREEDLANGNIKRSYFKVVRNGIVEEENDVGHKFDNFLILNDEQMQKIKHIKLGKKALLFINNEMTTAPDLTVETDYDTPENTVLHMQKENPQITFIQVKNSKNSQLNHTAYVCDFICKTRD